MSDTKPIFSTFSAQFGMLPQEAMLSVDTKKDKLFIGIPRERSFQENRVALTPEAVELLVNREHRIVVEAGAGEKSFFYDRQYAEAGAEIAYDVKKVFEADIILKAAPITENEIGLLKLHQTVFSPIHLPTLKPEILYQLLHKKVTTVAYEYIKDEGGSFPVVRTLSEIAGSSAILIGAEYLSNLNNGPGILMGGISGVPPAKVVILGAGVVGEFAARAALGLGAEVRVFDNNIYKLMRLQNNVNVRVYTSVINPNTLEHELSRADLAVGAIHSESGRTPVVVTENMVRKMKAGSVIVDVSIDQGGCFETSEITTHDKPVFIKHDVIHYCVPNIASRVSKTASLALSHVLTPLLLKTHHFGGFDKLLQNSGGVRNGVYIYKGHLTNRHMSERFGMRFTDLDLLIVSTI
ncbi:alanine dehydrogenase [Sphingobacteriales bacterium UPWRP_1]|nr:alanine dehydrogenase [Sphingobacteriales bacterium TSM_CSM]PSJ71817.1 alanine dehydrogenase [Sphingobacteriales bacterium UPWRP_1]